MEKQKLINKLRKIRDIPTASSGSCHADHENMSDELNDLISDLIGKCKCCERTL